jgi:hypothetical protein
MKLSCYQLQLYTAIKTDIIQSDLDNTRLFVPMIYATDFSQNLVPPTIFTHLNLKYLNTTASFLGVFSFRGYDTAKRHVVIVL